MYLSEKTITKAYSVLTNLTDRTGKKAIEVTSALRYLVATSALLHNQRSPLDLSIDHEENRRSFIAEVGNVVSITPQLYTNNFDNEFLTNADFAVRNNFLTTRLKTDGDYPGRPAPLLVIESERVKIHPNARNNLRTRYHNFADCRIALSIWLLRNDFFKINKEISEQSILNNINDLLETKYERVLSSVLRLTIEGLEHFLTMNDIEVEEVLVDKKYDFENFVDKFNAIRISEIAEQANVMLRPPVNLIFYGPPGTGKSFEAEKYTKRFFQPEKNNIRRVTFHPDYDYFNFVGSYKPRTDASGNIRYQFSPQIFTKLYVSAWKNLNTPYFLVIEEINRGNCAQIFGDLFQLLDRGVDGNSKYQLNADEDLEKYLIGELGMEHDGIKAGKISLPNNFSIIATMNTSDQSLFPMDNAFKRRWDWEYVPIDYSSTDSNFMIELVNGSKFEWLNFLEVINQRIVDITGNQDKQIGNWFINAGNANKIIREKQLINKVIFYLWNDVFKDEDESIFKIDGNNLGYQDFFINNINSELIQKLLLSLGLKPINQE